MSKYAEKYNLISKTEMLLYDILIEIERLADSMANKPIQEEKKITQFEEARAIPIVSVVKDKPKKQNKVCSSCGNIHENGWEYGLCARNKKKEGAVK
jgi:hypothetical protein